MEWIEYFNQLDFSTKLYYIVIIAFIPVMILGIYTQYKVNSTFKKYSSSASLSGITGSQAARQMLDENGLSHVMVQRTPGKLTDHYDPKSDIIFLSDSTFDSPTVAAVGVACHEAGHAVQHNENYIPAKVRMAIVPVVNFSSRIFFPIMIIGLFLNLLVEDPFIGNVVLYISLALFGMSTLFMLITLPTEFNASKRALHYVKDCGSFSGEEAASARKVLSAAAMTYVASFLMSLLQLLRYVAIILMRTRRRK